MVVEEPSTRTRVSFKVAMTKLGGHALSLQAGGIHLGALETLTDAARALSRMCEAIEARVFHHEDVLELARWSSVPVCNGLSSDYNHSPKAACDAFTMPERLTEGKALEDWAAVLMGDRTGEVTNPRRRRRHPGRARRRPDHAPPGRPELSGEVDVPSKGAT